MMQQVQKTAQLLPTKTQSLTLVKELLSLSISAVSYLRGLFPEENYEGKEYAGTVVKKLRRDYSSEGNRLLNFIEYGVYDAIENHYLRQVIFAVFLDPSKPEEIIESYKFDVSYPDDQRIALTFADQRMGSNDLQTVHDIEKSISRLIRSLIALFSTMKDLPPNRYVTIKLLYYDEVTPADYQPKFFKECIAPFVFNCDPLNIPIGGIKTQHHSVSLSLQSAADTPSKVQPSTVQGTHADDKYAPVEDVVCQSSSISSLYSSIQCTDELKASAPQQPSHMDSIPIVDDEELGTNSIGGINTQQASKENLHDSDIIMKCAGNSQTRQRRSSNGVKLTKELQKIHDESLSQSQTHALIVDSGERLTRRRLGALQISSSNADSPIPETEIEDVVADDESKNLNKNKKRRSNEECPAEVDTDTVVDDSGDSASDDNLDVGCICQLKESDEGMIQCDECQKWSHVVCFGYFNHKDPRINSSFLCSCSNAILQAHSPAELKKLALFRRVISVVWNENDEVDTDEMLARRLSIPLHIARSLVERLSNEGLIVLKSIPAPPKLKKRGRPRKSSSQLLSYKFAVVKSSQTKLIVRRYFQQDLNVVLGFISGSQNYQSSSPSLKAVSDSQIQTGLPRSEHQICGGCEESQGLYSTQASTQPLCNTPEKSLEKHRQVHIDQVVTRSTRSRSHMKMSVAESSIAVL